jgi:hypothetical protein
LDNVLHWCAMVGGFVAFLVFAGVVVWLLYHLVYNILFWSRDARAREAHLFPNRYTFINGDWVPNEKLKKSLDEKEKHS